MFHPWRGQGQKEWPWLRIFKRSELQQFKWLNEYGEAWNFTKCMGLGTSTWPFALYTIRTPQVPWNAIFMFSCFCSLLLGPMKLGLSPGSETLQSELGMWCKVTLWARPFNKHLRVTLYTAWGWPEHWFNSHAIKPSIPSKYQLFWAQFFHMWSDEAWF